MGLVFFLSLSFAPLHRDIPVLEVTVDSHDLYSILDCADILARRSYASLVPFLPARYRGSIQEVLEIGGHGGSGWAGGETWSNVDYWRYGVSVSFSRGDPPHSIVLKPVRVVFKPGSVRGALKAGN